MSDEIEINPNDTTEVRYRVDALRQDPVLEQALLSLAKQGVTSLTTIAVSGTDGEQTFSSQGLRSSRHPAGRSTPGGDD